MKFVADVNVPKPLITALRADGHDVIWITDIDRRLKDQPSSISRCGKMPSF